MPGKLPIMHMIYCRRLRVSQHRMQASRIERAHESDLNPPIMLSPTVCATIGISKPCVNG